MLKVVSLVSSFVLALTLALPTPAAAQELKKVSANSERTEFFTRPTTKKARTLWQSPLRRTQTSAYKFRSPIPASHRALNHAGGPMRAASAAFPNLYGSVTYSANESMSEGLYSISSDAALTLEKSGVTASYGGTALNGVYYYVDGYTIFGMTIITVYGYDIESGERLFNFSGDEENMYVDMTSDPVSGTIYALGMSETSYQLMKVAITENSITNTVVADLPGGWNALACDGNGQLYAISQDFEGDAVVDSYLYKVDKLTGALTKVGSTGQLPHYWSSATIDPKSGKMFWTVCPYTEEGLLCEVNTDTGAATVLGKFAGDEEVQGLFVRMPLAEDDAPAVATDLAASFPDGSFKGTLEFNAPMTLFDGTPAEGEVKYEVSIEGVPVRTATTSYGEPVTVELTLAKSGLYNFSVVMSNAAGKSPVATTSAYVGMGAPATPQEVTLNYSNGNMQLSWAPVTTTIDGIGHITPDEVTYTVTRFPDDVVVYEGKDTSFSEVVEEPASLTQFFYTVVAHSGDMNSAAATSNAIALGSIVPPYSNTFDSEISLEGYTILDANGDNIRWTVDEYGRLAMKYNDDIAMDDWIITPRIKLEAGKAYKVTFEVKTKYYNERIEAKWGMAPTVEGMTETIVPPTDIDGDLYTDNWCELGDYITPSVTGIYYIGFHGMSDAGTYYLYLDNLSISAPVDDNAPAAVVDLKALTDPDGAFKTTVSFTAPDKTYGGADLSAISKIEVLRDGNLVYTFENVTPGQACSFVDEVGKEGDVTYRVVAYNEAGAGNPAEVTTFVGIDVPAAPTNLRITDSATDPGMITVSWDAVTTDRNGQPINPSLVTYTIAEYEAGYGWVDMKTGITDTFFTFRAVDPGKQAFVQYAVYSETTGGYEGTATDIEPVGTPYNGVDESFPGGHMTYDWAVDYSSPNAKWGIYTDSSVSSSDGDNGFAGMLGYNEGSYSSLISAKISLEGCTNPGVSFFVYSQDFDNENTVEVFVREAGTEEWNSVKTFKANEVAAAGEWGLVAIPLPEYAGKTIQLRIQAMTITFSYTFVDNIHVGSLLDYDLAATAINGPEAVKPGDDYSISVKVSNVGVKTVDAYSVELYADGEKVATKAMTALAAGMSAQAVFDFTLSPVATEPIEYKAVVVLANDEQAENNESESTTVAIEVSALPRVTDLDGKLDGSAAVLTWTAPDVNSAIIPTKEDFENATSWEQSYEDWTFVDLDGEPVAGFQNMNIPGIEPGETTASFIVFDANAFGLNQTLIGHSGNKYLGSMVRYDDGKSDDWAISPELSGDAQTISFWARSYSSAYPEQIEMYYTMGGKNLEDFVKVGDTETVPNEWTEYKFDVPEGALFFAVRSCATGAFLLMLDDFTFMSAKVANISIEGYDVYRDGVKLNTSTVTECAYTDSQVPAGVHTYVVITRYSLGDSAPSNAVTLSGTTGIEDAVAGNISIAGGKGTITVAGAEGQLVTIAAADGKVVFSGEAAARQTVEVSAGIYVVRAGTATAKVAVK